MKLARQVLLSWGIGAALVFLLFGLGGVAPSLVEILLRPGMLLAGLAGYGAHDLKGFVIAILGDSMLYGLLSSFVLWVLRPALWRRAR